MQMDKRPPIRKCCASKDPSSFKKHCIIMRNQNVEMKKGKEEKMGAGWLTALAP
jgi:hypothetical protein